MTLTLKKSRKSVEIKGRYTAKLAQRTTSIRWQMLSLPKPIPIQLFLHKTNTCLRDQQPLFYLPNEKKNLSKMTTTNLYPMKK